MKKIFIFISLLLIMSGCAMKKDNNTPTKKVEEYLDGYQKLDSNVLNDLDAILTDTDYTVEQKARYKEIMKKHYSNIKYDITKETIDGDQAKVDAQVTVTDYSNILKMEVKEDDYKDETGTYSPALLYDHQLDLFEKETDKITYNITFTLTKNNETKEWTIVQLDDDSIKKIHGIYIK